MENKFKNTVASVLMAGTLFAAVPGHAASISQTMSLVGSTVGLFSSIMYSKPFISQTFTVNVDPLQLAAEYLVLFAMQEVTHEWPPMQDEYTKAGKNNEDDKTVKNPTSKETALPFEIHSLTAVGLESLELKGFEPLVNGRPLVIEYLTKMQVSSDGAAQLKSAETSDKVLAEITQAQTDNYHLLSTAGIARAELGLKSTYAASALARGNQTESPTNQNEAEKKAEETFLKQQNLTEMPAGITSIAYGMRVQSLMNLELAQRINLSNTLQGNILSIEAARALTNAGKRRNF